MRSDLPANDSTHRLRSLIDLLFERIMPHGFVQLVNAPTHSWPGTEDSCIDHVYSNAPEKLSQIQLCRHGSDHKLLYFKRYSNSIKKNTRYLTKRCYRDFDPVAFCRDIETTSWFDIYTMTDANIAAKALTDKIVAVLDKHAPCTSPDNSSQKKLCPLDE